MTMAMENEGAARAKRVRVAHGGEVRYGTADSWNAIADELIKKHGAGVPSVTWEDEPLVTPLAVAAIEPAPASKPAEVHAGEIDATGQVRSKADFEAAIAHGFAPRQSVYARGTRVMSSGVKRARSERRAHDRKPLVTEYCGAFIERIAAEERTDVAVEAHELTMDPQTGAIVTTLSAHNVLGDRFMPTEDALSGMASRLGYGGGQYLGKCEVSLRAENVNRWRQRLIREAREAHDAKCTEASLAGKALPEYVPAELVLRVRKNPALTMPEHFGTVTPSYTAFDVDKVAMAIQKAVHPEARGTVTYDGSRARFEVMFHSNVQPEHYVAGEFFKAGILIRTDDTGGGSCWGQAVVWQNLCLNLMIIDRNCQEMFRLRHMGSLEELVKRFEEGFVKAQQSLDHFVKAWGYACTENVLERSAAISEHDMPIRIEDALPGIFNAVIERDLVPVRARATDAVPKLMKMWQADESGAKLAHGGLTRGSIINAFTRYAHEEAQPDIWAEDEIQRAASALVWPKGTKSEPAPLPYLPFDPK